MQVAGVCRVAKGSLIIAVGLLCLGRTGRAQMTSPSYRLEPVAFGLEAGRAISSGFIGEGLTGQSMTVGTSSAPHFVLQSGFFGYLGSGLVPVLLTVSRVTGQPGAVQLTWSGNNAPYQIYRATDCPNVFSWYLDSTPDNQYTDPAPPQADLVCYSVLATAPGPRPERQPPSSGGHR